jgi:prepilin signal peptidase PulO-like enzyme (type II secretory pathway)
MAFLFFALYALVLLYKNDGLERIVAFFLIWLLLLLALADCWTGILPNWFTYTGIIVLLLLRMLGSSETASYLFGGLFGGGFLYLLAKMTGAIGIGDSKLLAMIGLGVGFPLVFAALWLATASALFYVLVHRVSFKEKIPFGPHLAAGAILSFLWGENLLEIYFS